MDAFRILRGEGKENGFVRMRLVWLPEGFI